MSAENIDNDFPSSLERYGRQRLITLSHNARQNENIFYATDPPENRQPAIQMPPPSIVDRLTPGVPPLIFWGAIALVATIIIRKSS
jgi:hypothetical protein